MTSHRRRHSQAENANERPDALHAATLRKLAAGPTFLGCGPRGSGQVTAQTCLQLKTVCDRAGQSGQDGTCVVRNDPHPERSLSLEEHLGRDAGQSDMRDAGAHEGLCGEVWGLHQQINHEPALLCFLVIVHYVRDINFGTPCTYIHPSVALKNRNLEFL